MFHGGTGDDQAIQGTLGQGFIPAHIELVEMVLIPTLVGMGVEPNPNRFDLQHRKAQWMQQVELVLLAQRHDVQNADTQGPNVLAFGLFRLNPGNPVAFNLRDFVVTARKDQGHGSWDVIQLRTARACSKSALMSSMCSSPTETRTIVGVTPAEACSASLSCWWVVDAG